MVVISALLPRLTGQLELGPSGLKAQLAELEKKVTIAEKELPPGPVRPELESSDEAKSAVERYRHLLDSVAVNPEATLLQLAAAVEREVRNLLAQTGWVPIDPALNFPEVMRKTTEDRGYFPESLTSSLRVFWSIRNSILHLPGPVPSREIIKAVDLGMSILRMVDGIPHEVHVVYHPGVKVFEDAQGKIERPGVLALLSSSTSPGGTIK